MKNELEKIKAKIAALIAKAEGTDNEHEAETFMSKAHELLERYNLSRLELDPEGHTDPLSHDTEAFTWFASSSWHGNLYNAASHFYGCKMIRNKIGANKYSSILIGREAARETVKIMYPYIVEQVKAHAKTLQTRYPQMSQSIARRQMAAALTSRIWNLVHKWSLDKGNEEKALVPVDENQAYMDSLMETQETKGRSKGAGTAAHSAAGAIKLSRGVKANTRRLT